MVRVRETVGPGRAFVAETAAPARDEREHPYDSKDFGRTKSGGPPIDVDVYTGCYAKYRGSQLLTKVR